MTSKFNLMTFDLRFIITLLFVTSFMACTNDVKDEQSNISSRNSKPLSNAINDSINNILSSAQLHNSMYENKIRSEVYAEYLRKDYTPQNVFGYAKEALNNGDTDAAMKVMQEVLDKYPNYRVINEQSRLVHEFLATCYLRKGEQLNCQQNHTDESCIIPIRSGGVYKIKNYSEQAIQKFEAIMKAFPDDMQSRWLLNLAYMTLNKYPDEVPSQYLINIEQSKHENAFQNITSRVSADHFALSGSVVSDDFNNDGYLDLFMTSWGSEGQLKLFINNKRDGFEDHSNQYKLSDIKGGLNTKQADYNNDGFLDLYITRGAWIPKSYWGILPNSLLRNNGDGTFSDVTIQAGLYNLKPTQSVEWADFNNDGFLDLFVANETTASSDKKFSCDLFFGSSSGVFTNVASKYGMDKVGYFKGCSAGDVNNDGWMDLYLSNLDGDNLLFVNTPKGGKFSGFTLSNTAVKKPKESFPCWFFDYNNDGWDDLYAASYDRFAFSDQAGQFARKQLNKQIATEPSRLYLNNNGQMKDVSQSQIDNQGISTMGCNYGDIDNDGFQDFYLGTGAPDYRAVVPNRFFKNQNGQTFDEQTFAYNLGHIQKGHGISFADLDNDGDLDIYAVMGGAFKGDKFSNAFFENTLDADLPWIKLKLEGETSNKSAIGAKIWVDGKDGAGNDLSVYKTVNSGASFGGNPLLAHLGLGQMKEITSVKIKWPNGKNHWTDYQALQFNSAYLIKENQSPVKIEMKKMVFDGEPTSGHHHHH